MNSQILYRLLFDHQFKTDALSAEELDALSAIDQEQLQKTVRRLELEVRASLGGFAGTLADVGDESRLIREFMRSPEFARSSEAPVARACISVEEAFYRFTLREVGPSHRLEHEFMTAMMVALAKNQDPYFQVEDPRINRTGDGYLALLDRGDVSDLYATQGNQTIFGQIPKTHDITGE